MSLTSTPVRESYTPIRSPHEIWELYESRKRDQGPDIMRMREIDQVMNNEMWLPLPELSQEEKPAVANLAQQGMNQLARRIASVTANTNFPALNSSKAAHTDARNRERIMKHWQHKSRQRILAGKRARHFLAFACAPVVLKPDGINRIPRWFPRNPLQTFPADSLFEDAKPIDCIFATTHTYAWILQHYPEAAQKVAKPLYWDNTAPDYDLKFTVLEYCDDVEWHLVICANDYHAYDDVQDLKTNAVTATAYPNRAGTCCAIVPGSISLTKQQGHFDGIIGMYQAQAALMALGIVAQRRAVWPREWAESHPGQIVDIPTIPDPYAGVPGEVNGGKIVQQKLDPSMQALELQDRLEYAQRMTAGLPPEFGGQGATNVRTGRRGAQVMGATVDFTISEAQDIFADATYEEQKVAIAIDKAYFRERRTVHIVTKSFSGAVSYQPGELWKSSEHLVEYPIAGTDLANLPVEGGQRVMMQTMSRETFMEIDPVIGDAKAEQHRIVREGLEQAFLASIQQQASMPEGPYQPAHFARLMKAFVSEDKDLWEAVEEIQKEIQEAQAQEVDPAAPEANPGLSMPGQGVEQPTPPVDDTSLASFTSLLQQLGQGQMAARR